MVRTSQSDFDGKMLLRMRGLLDAPNFHHDPLSCSEKKAVA